MPCPFGIDIPGNLAVWNKAVEGGYADDPGRFLAAFRAIAHFSRADHCIECGACEFHCPQKIVIHEAMIEIENHVWELENAQDA